MNQAQCEFLAENELVQILPNFNEPPMHLISGEVGPFEAQVPVTVPIWLALHLKRRQKCSLVLPEWLTVNEVKRLIVTENERPSFGYIPKCLFEIAHIFITTCKEDVDQVDKLRTLIKDLWDKREAKMRTSTIKFLGQYETAHAQLNNLTRLEIAYHRSFISESAKALEKLNDNMHAME